MTVNNQNLQLSSIQNIREAGQALEHVQSLYSAHFSESSFCFVKLAYLNTRRLFEGQFPGYMACTTRYHDFEHTMDVMLAAGRLLDGALLSGEGVDAETARNLFLAALLHDSGYIQERGDREGTGAKYTSTHVSRSIAFLWNQYRQLEINPDAVESIARIIRATDFNTDFNEIDFVSQEERLVAAILGTSDILGQMSGRAYLEKLLFLYYEFQEAGLPGYSTEFDIMRNTRPFYHQAMKRCEQDYDNVSRFAEMHFRVRYRAEGDLYRQAIDRQMDFLDDILNDATSNFRNKLKRWNSLPLPHYCVAG